MKVGDRVLVPSYRSWNDKDEPVMVTDEKHMTGTVDKLKPLSTIHDDIPAPGTDFHAWVILDDPIGLQTVIQCRASRLTKI